MYITFISQKTAGGSNSAVRLLLSLRQLDEIGAAYGLYVLDLVQTAFITSIAWTTLCGEWGNPAALMHTNWGVSMTPVVSGMSEWCTMLYQTF